MPWHPPPDPVAVVQRRQLELALDREIPNWREFDRDPWWHAWLATTHLYSKASRGWHLDAAAARGDAGSVIAFYRDFASQRGRVAVHEQPQDAYRPTGKRIYSRAEISDMSRRRQKGQVDDTTWRRWEIEMVNAGREGRIAGALPLSKTR
jgi:hypothetical protein